MTIRLQELISELMAELPISDHGPDETLAAVAVLAIAALLHHRAEQQAAKDPGSEWMEPEQACSEFGLDLKRLSRRWRSLPYCGPRAEGGRGFRVSRPLLKKHLAAGRAV